VLEAQLIQEEVERVRVVCVPGKTYGMADRRRITAHLKSYMGPVDVVVEEVAAIERSANSKLHSVVCRVPLCVKTVNDHWPQPCREGCDECPRTVHANGVV
jgi:hypothetical protein